MYDLKNLKIGDRLIRGKGALSQQCGIYVGMHRGAHLVAENVTTRGLCYASFADFLGENTLERIEHFQGNEQQRKQIAPFIDSKIGTNYDLSDYNQAYFTNLAQTPKVESPKLYRALVLGVLEYVWYRSFDLQDC